ncbi:MAG: peptidoglycan-binding protein, partial [Acidovorax sp.]|nr:peptidoglycan-binding protein [Acidovorax sp.]
LFFQLLEQLRLLTNLETSERKLLQIILIGQPELRAMVAAPELEQLAQRVIARYHLDALSADETRQYIAHRLAVAGLQGPLPFQQRALARVHALTGGVPRRINLLCDRALLGAYGAGVREVTDAMVRRAAREVFDAPATVRPGAAGRWLAAGTGGLVGAAALGGLAWALGWWPLADGGAGSTQAQAQTQRPAIAASAAAVPASSPASAASAPDAPALPPTLAQFLAIQPVAQAPAAWQALARQWQASVPDGATDPCAALAPEGLRCYRSRRASLNLLRQLDRPVLLMLRPAEGDAQGEALAPEVAVLLRRLDDGTATLEGVQGQTLQVRVTELAPLWRGE